MLDSAFSINFPGIVLLPWRPRFLASNSLRDSCWMPAEPGDVMWLATPFYAEMLRLLVWLHSLAGRAYGWQCFASFLWFPHLSHVFICPSLSTSSSHCLLHLHSSRVWENGLEEQMFTSCSLRLSRYTLFHWSVSHLLVFLIVQDVWGLRTVLCCSSFLILVKPVTLESSKYNGGKYRNTFLKIKIVTWSIWKRKIPMTSGNFQWNNQI